MKPYSVLIVDDHPMFREALKIALSLESDFEVVGQAVDGQQAVISALELCPDVIVMDLNMPVLNGVEAIAEILRANPAARILAITSSIGNDLAISAVENGATGIMLKDASNQQFMEGLRMVASGKQYLPAIVALKLMNGLRQENFPETQPALTGAEQDVLRLIGKGFSNESISKELNLSSSAVQIHFYNILKKLSFETRSQAAEYAVQHKN